ncbi:MAG: hypothetical protein VKJ05_04215 [Synechococcaceae cyanobacterium]|nr:hypothetical protein [Synechococcaceae cyanobacterium]
MPRYRCRSCNHRPPLPLTTAHGGAVVCGHCGSLMERRSLRPAFGTLLLSGGLFALCWLALPDALTSLAMLASGTPGLTRLVAVLDPPPEPSRRPLVLLHGDLFDRLAEGDLAWIPTAEPVPGEGIRYSYRRRLGEPPLSVPQIQRLMANPPDHVREREAITLLLQELERVGVAVELAPTRKAGAAGEWDHAVRTIRVQPMVVEKGTVEFLRVLNHEAIHVAQSCVGGGVRARPLRLGLDTRMPQELSEQLGAALYAGSSPVERALEKEAYANQHRFDLGAALVRRHCAAHPALG